MSRELTLADKSAFEVAHGETFEVLTDDGASVSCTLTLMAVTALPPNPLRAEPFSLTFSGDPEIGLGQGTYLLRSQTIEAQPIFIVQCAPVEGIPHYEAIYN